MTDYEQESKVNNRKAEELFKMMFPGLNLPYAYVYELLRYLDETKVNVEILPRVIRGVSNIEMGTKKGQVIVHIQKEVMNVSVRETDEELKVRM